MSYRVSRKLSPERWQKLQPVLGKLLSISQFTPIYYSWRPTSPDPGDDFLVDCGLNASAAIITSNLKDLKIAQTSLGLLVLTPAELVIKLATDCLRHATRTIIMSRLTLRLPETLHQQLAQVAEQEGVSLNQYIVYALTRQTANFPVRGLTVDSISAQPDPEIEQQQSLFQALKDRLGEASSTDIDAILADREVVTCEPELTTDTIDSPRERLRQRLRAKLQAAKQ